MGKSKVTVTVVREEPAPPPVKEVLLKMTPSHARALLTVLDNVAGNVDGPVSLIAELRDQIRAAGVEKFDDALSPIDMLHLRHWHHISNK
jgi:hypothetical protein